MTGNRWTSTSDRYLAPTSDDAWATEAAEHADQGTQHLGDVGEIAASDDVAAALNLTPGAPVVVRRRVMLLNGQPVELTDSYYPTAVASGTPLAEPAKIPGGAVTLLANLGYTPHDVREDITARPPTPEDRLDLNIPEQEPVIILTRTSRTRDGRPYEYSVMTMVARGRRLTYRMAP